VEAGWTRLVWGCLFIELGAMDDGGGCAYSRDNARESILKRKACEREVTQRTHAQAEQKSRWMKVNTFEDAQTTGPRTRAPS
jgi:hypothetical protein